MSPLIRRRELLRNTFSLAGSATILASRGAYAAIPADSGVSASDGPSQRGYWVDMVDRVSRPVLAALSREQLHAAMPVECAAGHDADRRKVTYLEALGRTLAGIAPWLEHGPRTGTEGAKRQQLADMARASISVGVDKHSADYLRFGEDRQTIVDSAFLSLALARAPKELCEKLPPTVRTRLADGLRATRELLPPFNNWLLFSAMIEACLLQLGESWDRMRIDYALREHAGWYLGDGTYGDGPAYHSDYYNSFVIQPFLLALMDTVGKKDAVWAGMEAGIVARARRAAFLQERMIAPDGTYPVVGRSIAYRCGAFHLLSDVALRRVLPEGVSPAQTRCAITAVIQRTLGASGTFDRNGWLQIGLAGHQPSLGETYISTGSLYLCTTAFLALGLAPDDSFWAGAAEPWGSQRLWQGENLPADHAL